MVWLMQILVFDFWYGHDILKMDLDFMKTCGFSFPRKLAFYFIFLHYWFFSTMRLSLAQLNLAHKMVN